MTHAPVGRCRAMSFHRTHQQSHCRRRSPVAQLYPPQCTPALGKAGPAD
jgi:hypothetical protein